LSTPYFSVVTPSWNQAAWLEGCIKSVLQQNAGDFEHIVYDNCSTDGTAEVLARYPHLIVHIEKDTGQSNALNKAFRETKGEVICWLNADDQYMPGAFEKMCTEMSKPGVDVVFGDSEEDFFDGKPPAIRKAYFRYRRDLLTWWEKRTDILQPAVFFRRKILDTVGTLREDLHFIMDTELWWRISGSCHFHYVSYTFARQQRQPDSKTIKHMPRIYDEKRAVFGALLNRSQPRRKLRNYLSMRVGMGNRWLGFAQSYAVRNWKAASRFLLCALKENPFLIATPSWWKAFYCVHKQG